MVFKPGRTKLENYKCRQAATEIVVGNTTMVPLPLLAKKLNQPYSKVADWAALPVNPLPTYILPSPNPKRRGQTHYAILEEFPAWFRSYAVKQKPAKTGRIKRTA